MPNGVPERPDANDWEGRIRALENWRAEVEKKFDHVPERERTLSKESEEDAILENLDNIGVQDLVIMYYRLRGNQTREGIKSTLEAIGKPLNGWFDGGNFNNRLVKKGILRGVGKDEKGSEIYGLTQNGERIADEKLRKYGRDSAGIA